jgi:phospho-N-acetylmuramoyl-pentapeptide-transferase
MILFVIDFLKNFYGIKVPAVFTYFSTRMMLASLTSFLFCIILGPSFIKKLYELKIGQSIRMEDCPLLGQLHEKKKDTPTMGGILILSSMLLSLLLWMDQKQVFTLILFITTVVLGLLGGRDDYLKLKYKNTRGISAKKKMAVQVIFSLVIAAYLLYPPFSQWIHFDSWFAPPVIKEYALSNGSKILTLQDYAARIYVPFLKDPLVTLGGWLAIFSALFMVFVIAGSSNAVNLTDGLDGLAAGCLIMVAGCLAIVAFVSNNIDIADYLHILYIEGSGEIAIYLSGFVGACLGFLWYNGYPAQLFMGDIGSLTLGGIIGVSAILLKKEVLLVIIGGIFVAEALSVILQVGSYKLRNKKRIFLCAPLHHHFEYMGLPETKVVMRFWIIGFLLAIVGIATLKFQ